MSDPFRGILLGILLAFPVACGDPAGPVPDPSPPSPSFLEGWFSGDSTVVDTGDIPTATIRGSRGSCQATLSWTTCPDDDFTRYDLYRSDSPGIALAPEETDVVYSTDSAEDTAWVEESLEWGESAWYAVMTVNEEELITWSNEEGVRMPGDIPEPSLLSADYLEIGIELTWSACRDYDFYDYCLFRSETPGIEDDIASSDCLLITLSPFDTTFVDSLPNPGTDYWYAVRTRNRKSFESWSNELNMNWWDPPEFPWFVTCTRGLVGYPGDLSVDGARELAVIPHMIDGVLTLFHTGSHDMETVPVTAALYSCLHPDGDRVYLSGYCDSVLTEVDLAQVGGDIRSLQLNAVPGEGCMDPSGDVLYLPAMDDHLIWVIDTESLSVEDLAYTDALTRSLYCHPSGEYLYGISRSDGTLEVLSTDDLETLCLIEIGAQPMHAVFSTDGSLLFVSCAASDRVVVLSVPDHEVVGSIGVTSPRGVSMHSSGRWLYVCRNNGQVSVFDMEGFEELATIKLSGEAMEIRSLPTGEMIVIFGSSPNWFVSIIGNP